MRDLSKYDFLNASPEERREWLLYTYRNLVDIMSKKGENVIGFQLFCYTDDKRMIRYRQGVIDRTLVEYVVEENSPKSLRIVEWKEEPPIQ